MFPGVPSLAEVAGSAGRREHEEEVQGSNQEPMVRGDVGREEVHRDGPGMQTLHILPWLCKQRRRNVYRRLSHLSTRRLAPPSSGHPAQAAPPSLPRGSVLRTSPERAGLALASGLLPCWAALPTDTQTLLGACSVSGTVLGCRAAVIAATGSLPSGRIRLHVEKAAPNPSWWGRSCLVDLSSRVENKASEAVPDWRERGN